MFEELVFSEKNKIQFLLDENDFYKVSEIINNNEYPKYFIQFLKGYLLEQLTKVRLDLADNYGIDVNDMELYDNWRIFEDSTYENYKLSKNKIEELVNNSINLNLNFLIRPKQTLVNFLFRDEIFQLPETIKIKLQYFDSELEIISKINIWLEEQSGTISIFHFRYHIGNIITNYFKENHFTKVAEWFDYLNNSVKEVKFNHENSTYNFLSILANDLNWNGLLQFLNLNKASYLNTILSESSINGVIQSYLAYWHKEETNSIDIEPSIDISKVHSVAEDYNVDDGENDIDDYDKMLMEEGFEGEEESYGTNLNSEVELEEKLMELDTSEGYNSDEVLEENAELDEYDKMLMEEEFEGEEESYGTNSDELQNEDVVEDNNNIWDSFSNNTDYNIADNNNTEANALDVDLEIIDQIMADVGKSEDSILTETLEESTELSEDDEFERMAALIAGGGDSTTTTNISPINIESDTVSKVESFSEIENLIENLNNKLISHIGTGENLKEVKELAQQTRLADLNFIDLNNPQFTHTKKELYQLLIDLKRKKAL